MSAQCVTAKPQAIEIRWLNQVLATRGLNSADMDARCGFRKGGFTQYRSRNFPSRPARAIVEVVLQTPLWSTPRVVELRTKCVSMLGYNPGTLTEPQLRAEVRKLGLKASDKLNLDQIEDVILSHLAPLNPAKATP